MQRTCIYKRRKEKVTDHPQNHPDPAFDHFHSRYLHGASLVDPGEAARQCSCSYVSMDCGLKTGMSGRAVCSLCCSCAWGWRGRRSRGLVGGSSMKPRHLRQPSKSIRACMQPHSVTFCSSQGNPTGWEVSRRIDSAGEGDKPWLRSRCSRQQAPRDGHFASYWPSKQQ